MGMPVKTLRERCKGCGLCVVLCPRKGLKLDEEVNDLGYYPVKVSNLEKCNQCGVCELICPDLAIFIRDEEDEE